MPSNPDGYQILRFFDQRGNGVISDWIDSLDAKSGDRIASSNLGDKKS